MQLADALFAALRGGDMKALGATLAADISVRANGGGKGNLYMDVSRKARFGGVKV